MINDEPIEILTEDGEGNDEPLTLADILTEAEQIIGAANEGKASLRDLSDWSLDLLRDLIDWAADQLP